MNSIITDVSNLTSVPVKTLEKLARKAIYSICDDVYENQLNSPDEIVEVDIGIGTLLVKVLDKEVKYRFKPNDLFAKSIRKMLENPDGYEPFASKLAIESLTKKFDEIYKDLC